MANLTTYGANELLNGGSIPDTLYAKLHIGNPGNAGTANAATELDRQSFTRTASASAAGDPGECDNVLAIEWLAYGTVESLSHLSFWDDPAAGNCWFVDAITGGPILTVIGQAVEIAAGELVFTIQVWT